MTPRFGTLFFRQVIRPWLRQPVLPALNILGIGLGVAVFLAIQIANRGALTSFTNAVALAAGRADLEIRGDNLPDTLFPAVAKVPGIRSATPLVEGILTLPDRPGEYLRLLGVDPFTGNNLRIFEITSPDGSAPDIGAWLGDPSAIAIPKNRLHTGPLRVLAGGHSVELTPRFVLCSDDAVAGLDERLSAMDIGWAQELLGLQNRLTSIQIELEDPLHEEPLVEALRKIIPPDATVAPPTRRGTETEAMLAAFQLNLTALGLVSMVVGVFLIYNSLSATVVRRRVEIGILRANGVTKAEISALFVGDALVCGLLGSGLGSALATPMAQILAAPVEQTISSLYTLVSVEKLEMTPWQIVGAFFVGGGSALLASWRPAMEAASCNPAGVLHPGAAMEAFSFRSRKWLVPGLVLLCLTVPTAWAALIGRGKFLGFVSAAFLLAGFSLLVPSAVAGMCSLIKFRSWMPRLGTQHLVRSLHRSAVTVAALSVAVAMTVSISVMIHSFRGSVVSWLEKTFVADLFIAPAANEIAGLQSFLPEEAISWARHQSRVKDVGTFREIQVLFGNQHVAMGVIGGGGRGKLDFLSKIPNGANLFHTPGYVVVSESFANRHGTKAGDLLVLTTPKGPLSYKIAGIIKDFTRDSGLVMMDRSNFERSWDDPRVHSLALRLENPALSGAVANEFRKEFGKTGAFSIYTNEDLRKRIMRIFEQTFAVTSVLRAIAVFVAIAGVLLSLTTLVAEREREIGVLRSQGASIGQIAGLILTEAGLIGLFASILGILCGAAMSMILTWVVNKAFFGWTVELRYPFALLACTPLWILPAAIVAAWLPALRASRIPPATAVRFE